MFSLAAIRRAVASDAATPVILAVFYTVVLSAGAVILATGGTSTSGVLIGAPLATAACIRLVQLGSAAVRRFTNR
ncbi:hypothetical protein [Arthrobacter sp. USHLN218]|uniref:hypothetical protein n=1 Tax=Arthrobacter sp. USHLN218 TaxID=3081232 RepID=UPI00301AF541